MTGATAFDLRRGGTASISKTQREVLRTLVSEASSSPLAEIADSANGLATLATCPIKITADVLRELGYQEPAALPAEKETEKTEQKRQLTPNALRGQLETRHNKMQERIEGMLSQPDLKASDVKTLQLLTSIDDKVIEKLLNLMNEEGAPLLPLSIIVFCLRQHGVAEEDIDFVINEVMIA